MAKYTDQSIGQFLIEVAKGNVDKHRRYGRVGRNPSIASAAPEMIWFAGGQYVWTTVGETVSIVSSTVNDAAAGTGWRKCKIFGLDQDYKEISEIITLNGLTPVNSVNSYIFISNVTASTAGTEVGSQEVNDGNIIGTGNTSAKTFFGVEAGVGTDQILFDIVPAGKTLYLSSVSIDSNKVTGGQQPDLTVFAFVQPEGLGRVLVQENVLETAVQSALETFLELPFVLPEKTRYWFDITTTENGTQVAGSVLGFTVENE